MLSRLLMKSFKLVFSPLIDVNVCKTTHLIYLDQVFPFSKYRVCMVTIAVLFLRL